MYVLFVSCFERSYDYLDLPSFPTRRSSDLTRATSVTGDRATATVEFVLRLPAQLRDDRLARSPELVDCPVRTRSEEHTSELQSLTNLVCRLLLEKKKGTENYNSHGRQSHQI